MNDIDIDLHIWHIKLELINIKFYSMNFLISNISNSNFKKFKKFYPVGVLVSKT